MKKYVNTILFVCVVMLIFFITACKQPKLTKREILTTYLEAESYDATLAILTNSERIDLLEIKKNKEVDSLVVLNDALFGKTFSMVGSAEYLFLNVGEDKVYSKIQVPSYDTENVIYQTAYCEDYADDVDFISYKFKISKYLTDAGLSSIIAGQEFPETVDVKAYIEDEIVKRLEYNIGNVIFCLFVNSYNVEISLSLPSFNDYVEVEYDILYSYIIDIPDVPDIPDIPIDPNIDYSNHKLFLNKKTIIVEVNKPIEHDFEGKLAEDSNSTENIITLNSDSIKLSKNIFTETGTYEVYAYTSLAGNVYTTKVCVVVNEFLENTNSTELKFLNNIDYIIENEEMLYLYNGSTLYKLNLLTKEPLYAISLKSNIKSHFLKGNTLYLTEVLTDENDQQSGRITIINATDFSIIDQISIDFIPEAIVVDKRNNLIVSEDDAYEYFVSINPTNYKVDVIGKISNRTIMIYDEVNDLIHIDDAAGNGGTKVYQYDEELQNYKATSISSAINSETRYKIKDGYVLVENCIYEYNEDVENYIGYPLSYSELTWNMNFMDIADDKVYTIHSNYNTHDRNIVVWDYLTGQYKVYDITSDDTSKSIKFMTIIDDVLYLIYKNGLIEEFDIIAKSSDIEEDEEYLPVGDEIDYNNYKLYLDQSEIFYDINVPLDIEITGYLAESEDATNNIIMLDSTAFTIPNRTFTQKATHFVYVSAEYNGVSYSATLSVTVLDYLEKVENTELNLYGDVAYVIRDSNYLYICDQRYINKYDMVTFELVSRLDLKAKANSHTIRDGKLYVSACYPYPITNIYDKDCDGTITVINLSTFTIEKQINVDCSSGSIIVDKRNRVFVSKLYNQHINISEVDLETGKLTDFVQGYEQDYIIYNDEADAIYQVATRSSRSTKIHYFTQNENGDVEVSYSMETTMGFDKLYKIKNNHILCDRYLYKYDASTRTYVVQTYDPEFGFAPWSNSHYIEAMDFDGENVYVLYHINAEYYTDKVLHVYDYDEKTFVKYDIEFEEDEKSFADIEILNNKIYLVTTNGKVLVYNLS